MGRGAPKARGNVWYQARLEAAIGNERLLSRFGAAEAMGLSEDAVKSAELGLYKSMAIFDFARGVPRRVKYRKMVNVYMQQGAAEGHKRGGLAK